MRLRTCFWSLTLLSILAVSALIYPANPLTGVTGAISQFCSGMQGILPVASMLMVLIGAVVYAAGQVLGTETRARANVWATAALTGALVAMLISSVTPPALGIIYGQDVSCAAGPQMCGSNPVPPGMACCSSPNGVGNAIYDPSLNRCCTTPSFPEYLWLCSASQSCLAGSPWCG